MNRTKHILAADDSLTIRKLVEMTLRQEGYEVTVAENGASCIEKARELKPDLILLDYVLPDLQGTEVCQTLINSPETWEIPVLMMSGNGNAIRQLYQDFNNVADYLTKPFAPNVLKAVISHILNKQPEATLNEMSAASDVSAAPAVESVVAPGQKKSKKQAASPRRRKVSTIKTPEALQTKFRRTIARHLRTGLGCVPEWERVRGEEAADAFYVSRLLSAKVLEEIASDLVRAVGFPEQGIRAFRCPAELGSLDGILKHLSEQKATGQLDLELEEETIQVNFRAGDIVFITSDHPRNYCTGAACNFHALPPTAIVEAVQYQEENSLPFFVFLKEEGHFGEQEDVSALLRAQGESALARAFECPDVVSAFYPLAKLPSLVRKYETPLAFEQALLVCYRTVEDWLTIEQSLPALNISLVKAPDYEARVGKLSLSAAESQLLQLVGAGRPVSDLLEASGLGTYNGSMVLYRFLKLGLLLPGDHEVSATDSPGTAFFIRTRSSSEAGEEQVSARPATLAELEHTTAVTRI